MGDTAGGEVGLTSVRLRREGTLFPDYGCDILLPFRKDEIKLWLTVFKAKHCRLSSFSLVESVPSASLLLSQMKRACRQVPREGD